MSETAVTTTTPATGFTWGDFFSGLFSTATSLGKDYVTAQIQSGIASDQLKAQLEQQRLQNQAALEQIQQQIALAQAQGAQAAQLATLQAQLKQAQSNVQFANGGLQTLNGNPPSSVPTWVWIAGGVAVGVAILAVVKSRRD